MNLAYHDRTSSDVLNAETMNRRHKAGQVFTPLCLGQAAAETIDLTPTARQGRRDLHIVDAGIGDGQLTLAVLARLGETPREDRPDTIRVTGVELDSSLGAAARRNLDTMMPWCRDHGMALEADVIVADFTTPEVWRHDPSHPNGELPIDIVISNPPYRRVRNDSEETRVAALAKLAVTGNTYTTFCEIGWRILRRRGQLMAITPRSFQNGPRFREFRKRLEEHVDLDQMHMWRNRGRLYGRQNVLQETVCWHGWKRHKGNRERRALVVVTHGDRERGTSWTWTTSGDRKWIHAGPYNDHRLRTYTDRNDEQIEQWAERLPTLVDLGLAVKTGRHIAHRHPNTLAHERRSGFVPYIDRPHVQPGSLRWPTDREHYKNFYNVEGDPKPLEITGPGWYVAVNRFAPNEDQPRIRACVITPAESEEGFIGSNQTNIIRRTRDAKATGADAEAADREDTDAWGGRLDPTSLTPETARSIAAWINTAIANQLITMRLGSTQVNAADLETLAIPPADELADLLGGVNGSPRVWPRETTEAARLLTSMMPKERHAAETTEQLRKVRRHLKLVLGPEPDLREDTTVLTLMALYGETSTKAGDRPPPRSAQGLSRYAIQRIDTIFGRRLNDESRWHIENRVWPWMLAHRLLKRDDRDGQWTRTGNLEEMMIAAITA